MRATWKTSLISGLIFGALAQLVDNNLFLGLLFLASMFFGVFGWPQLKETYKDVHARSSLWTRREDYTNYHFPTARRLLIWFLGAVLSGLLLKLFEA